MYKNNKTLLTLTAAVALSSLSGVALADYPERDIRVIVPWGAGGGTDGIVRKLTTIAEESSMFPCMQKTSRVA